MWPLGVYLKMDEKPKISFCDVHGAARAVHGCTREAKSGHSTDFCLDKGRSVLVFIMAFFEVPFIYYILKIEKKFRNPS